LDLSLSANVNDSNLSESIEEGKISIISKNILYSEKDNEQISNGKAFKSSKLDQSSAASFCDPNNALLKTNPHPQKIKEPFTTIIVPGQKGQEHCFSIRRTSLEKISTIYERKNASDSWNDSISCLWRKDDKDNKESYYHRAAANQVVLFAYYQA
jgi:hypothetical protein